MASDDPFGEDPMVSANTYAASQDAAQLAGAGQGSTQRLTVFPVAEGILILVAVAVIAVAPPLWAFAAWLLTAVGVPVLWALHYIGHRRARLAPDGALRWTQRLLLLSLAVGLWAAWVFATEVAK